MTGPRLLRCPECLNQGWVDALAAIQLDQLDQLGPPRRWPEPPPGLDEFEREIMSRTTSTVTIDRAYLVALLCSLGAGAWSAIWGRRDSGEQRDAK